MRSLLFVPADGGSKLDKAFSNDADRPAQAAKASSTARRLGERSVSA